MTPLGGIAGKEPVVSHETLHVGSALAWKRAVRLRRVGKQPRLIIAGLIAATFFAALIANIPRGYNSSSSAFVGVLFFADLLFFPIFNGRNFHVATTSAESQWILTAPGGPSAFLIEKMVVRAAITCVLVVAGLAGAAALGHGRSLPEAALLVLLVALSSVSNSSISSLAYKVAAGLRRRVVAQIAAAMLSGGVLLAMALRAPGLGQIASAAGRLVEGHLTTLGGFLLLLFCLTTLISFALVTRSATWYAEPMIVAGQLRDQAVVDYRRVKTRGSWEGGRRLLGPVGAFVYVELVHLGRFRRRLAVRTGIACALAVLLVNILHLDPLLGFLPTLGFALVGHLPKRPSVQARDEWMARAPAAPRAMILGGQARGLIEAVLLVIASSVPAAVAWNHGPFTYLLLALAVVLTTVLLAVSRNYTSVIERARPVASLYVRFGLPAVIAAVAWSAWLASRHSEVVLAASMATVSTLVLILIVELSVRAAGQAG